MTDSERIQELHIDMKTVLQERLPAIESRLTTIETKHSIWGAVAGFLGGIVAAILGHWPGAK